MVSDILMENDLTKNNSDFTEWHAVLCQYAKNTGSKHSYQQLKQKAVLIYGNRNSH
jgi:hypothetical protein